jgi:quercetin dioxygenase-like cupin family protein
MNKITHRAKRQAVELRPGIFKTNLSYNNESMLCHFIMKKGAKIELHNHAAVQNGYILHGKLKCVLAGSQKQIVSENVLEDGAGYVWDSMEFHSVEALEDSEIIEHFTPFRPEYINEYDS